TQIDHLFTFFLVFEGFQGARQQPRQAMRATRGRGQEVRNYHAARSAPLTSKTLSEAMCDPGQDRQRESKPAAAQAAKVTKARLTKKVFVHARAMPKLTTVAVMDINFPVAPKRGFICLFAVGMMGVS